MARRRSGRAVRGARANEAIATEAAPTAIGNGPAKAYRHKGEKRRNIPPTGIAADGAGATGTQAHPLLRFDLTGSRTIVPNCSKILNLVRVNGWMGEHLPFAYDRPALRPP